MFSKDLSHSKKQLIFFFREVSVRTLVIALLLFSFLYSGCGFQLERHHYSLINSHQSVGIAKVNNRSFAPQIAIQLRDQLAKQLSQKGVLIKEIHQADLILYVTTESLTVTRSEYALDGTKQIYTFGFTIKGKLSVVDRSKGLDLLTNSPVVGSYSLKISMPDLSSQDEDAGRKKSIKNLSEAILGKITDRF